MPDEVFTPNTRYCTFRFLGYAVYVQPESPASAERSEAESAEGAEDLESAEGTETMMNMLDEELTLVGAAELAGMSERTIRNWILSGKLPARTEKSGRKVRRQDVLAVLEEKGFAPPAMESVLEMNGIREEDPERSESPETESSERVEDAESEPVESAERSENGHRGTASVLSADSFELLLRPLNNQWEAQLQQERDRSERLHRENLELAGRIGFLQAKLQDTEQKLLTAVAESAESLERPKPESPERSESVETESSEDSERPGRHMKRRRGGHTPWWRRLFGSKRTERE